MMGGGAGLRFMLILSCTLQVSGFGVGGLCFQTLGLRGLKLREVRRSSYGALDVVFRA